MFLFFVSRLLVIRYEYQTRNEQTSKLATYNLMEFFQLIIN